MREGFIAGRRFGCSANTICGRILRSGRSVMRLTAITTVTLYGRNLTAYAGPSSWSHVPVGIYYDAAGLATILGGRLAPSIEAELPAGGMTRVCSDWLVGSALEAEGRKADFHELRLACRQADEVFANIPKGYHGQPI
jgi:hypothetical protein